MGFLAVIGVPSRQNSLRYPTTLLTPVELMNGEQLVKLLEEQDNGMEWPSYELLDLQKL